MPLSFGVASRHSYVVPAGAAFGCMVAVRLTMICVPMTVPGNAVRDNVGFMAASLTMALSSLLSAGSVARTQYVPSLTGTVRSVPVPFASPGSSYDAPEYHVNVV